MIRFLFLTAVALFLTIIPGAAFGQTGSPGTMEMSENAPGAMRVSPDEAVELAIKNNLGLERQRVSVATKQRASAYAWNKFLPTINLLGGANINSVSADTTGDFAQPDMTKQTVDTSATAFQGQAQVQLNINFALFEAVKALRMDYEGGLLSLEQAKLQMERDIRKSYYNIILLEEQSRQLQESLSNAERQAVSAEAQYRAGRQPELSYLQARVNVENMKPSVEQARNGLRLTKSQFAMTLGLPLDTDFELVLPEESVNYIPLDMKELARQAKDNNPEIRVQRQQLRALMSQRKAQMYQKWTPSISLGWTGSFSNQDSNNSVSTNLGNSKQNQSVSSMNNTVNLGLSWTVSSLLPFGPDAQSIKDLDDNVKTLSIALAQAEQGTELDITNKVYSLEQIRSGIEAKRAAVELAERSYAETLRAYNNGQQSLLQARDAGLQRQNARLNLSQQESDYLQGLIDLEYSIGVPFGSLTARTE